MANGLKLDVKVEIDGKMLSIEELLRIDQTDISNEFAAQASRYAYFSVLEAEAEWGLADAVRLRKEAEATAFTLYKNNEDFIPPGSRSVSDGYASQLVDLDNNVKKARVEEADAQYEYRLMRALATSFHQRADMLQSLGVMLRSEMDMTGMAVREDMGNSLRRTIDKRSTKVE